jgi:hypothetical protein
VQTDISFVEHDTHCVIAYDPVVAVATSLQWLDAHACAAVSNCHKRVSEMLIGIPCYHSEQSTSLADWPFKPLELDMGEFQCLSRRTTDLMNDFKRRVEDDLKQPNVDEKLAVVEDKICLTIVLGNGAHFDLLVYSHETIKMVRRRIYKRSGMFTRFQLISKTALPIDAMEGENKSLKEVGVDTSCKPHLLCHAHLNATVP